jgi:ribosomal protein S18 acetylase RimI-like enzyme
MSGTGHSIAMNPFEIRNLVTEDVAAVAALQGKAFPPPFDPELLWKPEHVIRHVEVFPEGQFVASIDGVVVGSCSNCILQDDRWRNGEDWDQMVGGAFIEFHDPAGSTLFGLDISVDPDARRLGIGRAFYLARYDLVRRAGLARFGTACRIPDFIHHPSRDPAVYVEAVHRGEATDRVLTALLTYGLRLVNVKRDFLDDVESANAMAILEWTPDDGMDPGDSDQSGDGVVSGEDREGGGRDA